MKRVRMAAALRTKDWVEFCCHFYTANPLTFECFSGEYPKHVTNTLQRIRGRAS